MGLVQAGRVDAEVGRYLNRLSDLLFAASRVASAKEGGQEIIWRKAVNNNNTNNKTNINAVTTVNIANLVNKNESSVNSPKSPKRTNVLIPNRQIFSEEVQQRHRIACESESNFYEDPTSGLMVMTEFALKKRGYCCGNKCRHCPYGHVNVPPDKM